MYYLSHSKIFQNSHSSSNFKGFLFLLMKSIFFKEKWIPFSHRLFRFNFLKSIPRIFISPFHNILIVFNICLDTLSVHRLKGDDFQFFLSVTFLETFLSNWHILLKNLPITFLSLKVKIFNYSSPLRFECIWITFVFPINQSVLQIPQSDNDIFYLEFLEKNVSILSNYTTHF